MYTRKVKKDVVGEKKTQLLQFFNRVFCAINGINFIFVFYIGYKIFSKFKYLQFQKCAVYYMLKFFLLNALLFNKHLKTPMIYFQAIGK